MITCVIALFASLTLVGPTSNSHGYGIHPDHNPNFFNSKPTSEFHSKLTELGVDIYHFIHDRGPVSWTNLTVISSPSDDAEQLVMGRRTRKSEDQTAVWHSILRIAGEVENQLLKIYGTKDTIPPDERDLKMLKYGQERMYIYESLRYQADLLIGLEVIDETIPPWSGTPEEQAARDELFTIIETWCPSFHRKEWKRD